MSTENRLLIGFVSAGFLILFLFDLLSTMSHDIRTPMNAIIGLTTIAEKNLGDMESVGANGFVSKPLFASKLYDKINAILVTEARSVKPENDYSDLEGLNILDSH